MRIEEPATHVQGSGAAGAARFVVVGETLIDIVPGGGADGTTRATCRLPGGSPANVAVTLGRLGRDVTLATTLADDADGSAARAWLTESEVRVLAQEPATGRTSTAAVVLAPDGSAAYEFDLTWDLRTSTFAEAVEHGADAIHAGSIATVLAPGADAVEHALAAARGRCLISIDPNARSTITPDVDAARSRVERLVSLADLVKVSEEDLHWYHPGVDVAEVARAWASSGPSLVVVTLGADGCLLVRGDEQATVPARDVVVADTIGAGDTFMGALLDAVVGLGAAGRDARRVLSSLDMEQLREAASWAATAAAVTVSRPGADPPTRVELAAAHDRVAHAQGTSDGMLSTIL